MKIRNILIGIVCGIALIVYAYFICKIYVYDLRSFGDEQNIALVESLEGVVFIDTGYSMIEPPYIGQYYSYASHKAAPYSLKVDISDNEAKYDSITIKTVTVTYSDGTVVEKKMDWVKEFHAEKIMMHGHINGWQSGPVVHVLREYIPDVVEKYLDCTIKLEGFLTTVGGEKVEFSFVADGFEFKRKYGVDFVHTKFIGRYSMCPSPQHASLSAF